MIIYPSIPKRIIELISLSLLTIIMFIQLYHSLRLVLQL